jgi:hypothetical protein
MPKGENLLAQSKRTAPPAPPLIFKKNQISKNHFTKMKKLFQLVSVSQKERNYFNWYLFHKREEIISITKSLLTAKGRISSGGAFI